MECLVTKLRERIDNNNLVPLDSILIHLGSSSVQLTVGANSTGVIGKIITPGVTFTNSVFSGLTEQEFPNGSYRVATVSGECDIILSGVSRVTRLQAAGGGGVAFSYANIDGLWGNSAMLVLVILRASGDINALKSMTAIQSISLINDFDGNGLYGDLADVPISSAMFGLKLNGAKNVIGDINKIAELPRMTDLDLYGTSVSGNVSALSNLADLRDVDLGRTNVTGSISSFAGISTLRNLQLIGCQITGNLGQLVNVPALKDATFPDSVTYTTADAERIDAVMASNGGTLKPTGHYFAGGTQVD